MLSVIILSDNMPSYILLSVIIQFYDVFDILKVDMLSFVMLSVVMLSAFKGDCNYAKCLYYECHYSECRGAVTIASHVINPKAMFGHLNSQN
jgi:hypothetical protein